MRIMKEVLLIIFILSTRMAFAESTDIRISDRDGHVLGITSDGKFQISGTNEGQGTSLPGAQDIRVCDDDGDCLNINSNGSITITNGLQ